MHDDRRCCGIDRRQCQHRSVFQTEVQTIVVVGSPASGADLHLLASGVRVYKVEDIISVSGLVVRDDGHLLCHAVTTSAAELYMRRVRTAALSADAFGLRWEYLGRSGCKRPRPGSRCHVQSASPAEPRSFRKRCGASRARKRGGRVAGTYQHERTSATASAKFHALGKPRITARTRHDPGHQARMNSTAAASLRRRRLAAVPEGS